MNREKVEQEIREIVSRETEAWDTKNVDLLLTIFHPDFVWVWPRNSKTHDPIDWVIELGKFDYQRWKKIYKQFFQDHKLIHNKRQIQKIEISKEGDGAFAVLDIDTLWVNLDGTKNYWKGRVCKVYAKVNNEWKLTMHTGVLDYSDSQKD